jgi:hypothetical protein
MDGGSNEIPVYRMPLARRLVLDQTKTLLLLLMEILSDKANRTVLTDLSLKSDIG